MGLRGQANRNVSLARIRLAMVQILGSNNTLERDRSRDRGRHRLDLPLQLELGTNYAFAITEDMGAGELTRIRRAIGIQPVRRMERSANCCFCIFSIAWVWLDIPCAHHRRILPARLCHALHRFRALDGLSDRACHRNIRVGRDVATDADASGRTARRCRLVLNDFPACLAHQESLGMHRCSLRHEFDFGNLRSHQWSLVAGIEGAELDVTLRVVGRQSSPFLRRRHLQIVFFSDYHLFDPFDNIAIAIGNAIAS